MLADIVTIIEYYVNKKILKYVMYKQFYRTQKYKKEETASGQTSNKRRVKVEAIYIFLET